jgi:hypothetical protein
MTASLFCSDDQSLRVSTVTIPRNLLQLVLWVPGAGGCNGDSVRAGLPEAQPSTLRTCGDHARELNAQMRRE